MSKAKEDFINTDKKKNSRALENAGDYTQGITKLGRPVFPETIKTQRESSVNSSAIEFRSKIRYPFVMIPVEIEKMELDVYARAVYQRISYRAGGHSSHFESQENMAKALFISTRQIVRKIKDLENKHMIHVEKRGKSKGGHFLTNVITLLDPSEWMYVHHVTDSHTATRLTVTPRGDSQSHITRSHDQLDPILNAAAQKPTAAVKRCRPPSKKMKLWEEKSESEKTDTLYNMCKDAHRTAIEQRKAQPYPWDDIPDMLKPMITGYGIQKIKDFFDRLKTEGRGCDVRKIAQEIDESVFQMTKKSVKIIKSTLSDENIHRDQINSNQSKNFTEEILAQVETNMIYANNLSKTETVNVKIEDFPLRLKKFYDSINQRNKLSLVKEIAAMGLEKYLQLRATAILKCSYDDLFVEQQPLFAQF